MTFVILWESGCHCDLCAPAAFAPRPFMFSVGVSLWVPLSKPARIGVLGACLSHQKDLNWSPGCYWAIGSMPWKTRFRDSTRLLYHSSGAQVSSGESSRRSSQFSVLGRPHSLGPRVPLWPFVALSQFLTGPARPGQAEFSCCLSEKYTHNKYYFCTPILPPPVAYLRASFSPTTCSSGQQRWLIVWLRNCSWAPSPPRSLSFSISTSISASSISTVKWVCCRNLHFCRLIRCMHVCCAGHWPFRPVTCVIAGAFGVIYLLLVSKSIDRCIVKHQGNTS